MYFKGLQRQVKWKANVLPCCPNTSNVLAGASNEKVGSDRGALHLAWEKWILLFGETHNVQLLHPWRVRQVQCLPAWGRSSSAQRSHHFELCLTRSGKPIGCKWCSWGAGDWDLLLCFAHLLFRVIIAELLWGWCQEEKQTVRISKAILILFLAHISSLFSCTSTFYGLLACFAVTHTTHTLNTVIQWTNDLYINQQLSLKIIFQDFLINVHLY